MSPILSTHGVPARAQPIQGLPPATELQGLWGPAPQEVLNSSRDSPNLCLTQGSNDPTVLPA